LIKQKTAAEAVVRQSGPLVSCMSTYIYTSHYLDIKGNFENNILNI